MDERVHAISGKAARLTVQVFGIAAAVLGATLLAVSRDTASLPGLVGFTLAYAACGLLVVYYLAYAYYQRKFGGE